MSGVSRPESRERTGRGPGAGAGPDLAALNRSAAAAVDELMVMLRDGRLSRRGAEAMIALAEQERLLTLDAADGGT